MKSLWQLLRNDRVLGVSISLTSIAFLAAVIIIAIFWRTLPNFFSLYPKLAWGYERVGTKLELLYPLIIFLGSVAGSLIILPWVYDRANLLGRFMALTIAVLGIFFLIFALQLVRIF